LIFGFSSPDSIVPVLVQGISNLLNGSKIVQISAGLYHMLVLSDSNILVGWGKFKK
jgi:hypothetical protein